MGREVKRVDLNNPPKKDVVWHGYLNPYWDHHHDCKSCDCSGLSPEAKRFQDEWYGKAPFDPVAYGAKPLMIDDPAFCESIRQKVQWSIDRAKTSGEREWYTDGGRRTLERALELERQRMFDIQANQWMHHLIQVDVDALIEGDRLYNFTHKWVQGEGWIKREGEIVVTAEQVNAWSFFGIAHDSINCWLCIKARCEREGAERTCSECQGEGVVWDSSEIKAKYEAWEKTEPPTGDGWQIWETVSEGSPVSPAFATPEELARWMVANDDSVTSSNDYDAWMKFIAAGWAPSLVSGPDGVQDGVAAVGGQSNS